MFVAGLLLFLGRVSRRRTRHLAGVAGGAAGLVAGGLLVTYVSWRWVMFVNVPIGIGVALAALAVLPAPPAAPAASTCPAPSPEP